MELYYLLGKKKRVRLLKSSDLFSLFQGRRDLAKGTLSRGKLWMDFLENFPRTMEWGAPKGLRKIFCQSTHFLPNYMGEADFVSSILYSRKNFDYGVIGFCHLRVEEPLFYHQSKIQWFSLGSFFSDQFLSQNEEVLSLFHQGRHWFSNLFHEKNTAFFLGKEVYFPFSSFRYPSFLVGLSLSERNRFWLGISGYKEERKVEFLENVTRNSPSTLSISSTSYEKENGDILLPSKLFLEEDGEWFLEGLKKTKKILGSSVDSLFRKFFHPFRDEMKVFDLEGVRLGSWRREERNLWSLDGKRFWFRFPFFFYSSEYLWNLGEEFLWDKFSFSRRERSPFFYLFATSRLREMEERFFQEKERGMKKREIWFGESSYYSPRRDILSSHSMNLRQTYKRHSLEREKRNYD